MSLMPVLDVEATVIPAMVERLVREFEPRRVILFGSYARGEARWGSDVDLLVVVNEVEDRRDLEIAMRRALRGLGAAKDVIVATEDEIAGRGRLVGSIFESALREGRILYERP